MSQVSKQELDAEKAKGEAMGASMLAEHQAQRGLWLKWIGKLIPCTVTCRAAIRTYLDRHIKQMREHVKVAEADRHPERESYKKAAASAQVMLSCITTIIRAMNAGYKVDCLTEEDGTLRHDSQGNLIPAKPFDWILAQSRVYLSTHAANGGEKKKRGRPAASFLDKLKKFLKENAKDTDSMKSAVEFCEARLARMEHGQADE